MGGVGPLAPSDFCPLPNPPPLRRGGDQTPSHAQRGREGARGASRGKGGGKAVSSYDTTIRGAARAGPWSPAIFSHTRLAIPRYALACSESG